MFPITDAILDKYPVQREDNLIQLVEADAQHLKGSKNQWTLLQLKITTTENIHIPQFYYLSQVCTPESFHAVRKGLLF